MTADAKLVERLEAAGANRTNAGQESTMYLLREAAAAFRALTAPAPAGGATSEVRITHYADGQWTVEDGCRLCGCSMSIPADYEPTEICNECAHKEVERLTALLTAAPSAPSPAAPQGAPVEVIAFLNGSAPLEGVWFGEDHPTESGKFWWRKYLNAAPQPEQADSGGGK